MTMIDGFVFASKERQLPEPEWWIPDLFIKNSVAMLSSQPKEGKSCFGSHLTFCVSTGIDFCGRPVPQGNAMYLAGERANQTEDRLLEEFSQHGLTPQNYVIYVPTISDLGLVKFNRDGDVDRLIDKIRQFNMSPNHFTIDTLTQFYEGSQNDEVAMHKFFVGVRKLADAFNACALVLHHDTKMYVDRSGQVSGGGAPRGSGDAFASVDTMLRARTRKELPDPDHEQREVRITEFELEADNFGGYFKETFAVRKLLEDPTPYLEADDNRRDAQKSLMLDVLRESGPMIDSKWKTAVREKLATPEYQHLGTLGNKKFEEMRDQLVAEKLVVKEPNPNRANGFVYSAA